MKKFEDDDLEQIGIEIIALSEIYASLLGEQFEKVVNKYGFNYCYLWARKHFRLGATQVNKALDYYQEELNERAKEIR